MNPYCSGARSRSRALDDEACYHPCMRKHEREISDPAEIDAILAAAKVVRLGFAIENEPYVVPLSHGYDEEHRLLYFHTATEGRKIDCIQANPRVCFEVEGRGSLKEADERGCAWGLKYESVIGYGTVREVLDEDQRDSALRTIMRQQSGRDADWTFAPKVLTLARVWAVQIATMTGKRSF